MAGFQQAANALAGAYGTIAGKIGIYNELVGKNKKLINELGEKNKELEDKNEELKYKNEELEYKNKTINIQKDTLSRGDELIGRYMKVSRDMYVRNMENERAQQSKRAMLDLLYDQPIEETPFFKKEDKGGK